MIEKKEEDATTSHINTSGYGYGANGNMANDAQFCAYVVNGRASRIEPLAMFRAGATKSGYEADGFLLYNSWEYFRGRRSINQRFKGQRHLVPGAAFSLRCA